MKEYFEYLWAAFPFPTFIYLATGGNGWAVVASISLLIFIATIGEKIENKIK